MFLGIVQHRWLDANVHRLNLDLMGTRVSDRRWELGGKKKGEYRANFKKKSVLREEMLVNTSPSKVHGNYNGKVILNLLTGAF